MPARLLVWIALIWGAACGTAPQSGPEPAGPEAFSSWEGIWENSSASGLYESWKPEGGVFAGKAFMVAGPDTTLMEKLTLEFRPEGVFYVAEVAHNPGPVAFKLVENAEVGKKEGFAWVFENPAHDFPQRIVYQLEDPDHLHVRIESLQKDGKGQDFYFVRMR